MASDKFKKLSPRFAIFKDGEVVRVKKLGAIVDKTQRSMRELEEAIGDIHNRSVVFEAQPLFQNSLGRSIGPVDELTITPAKRFAITQNLKSSIHQGLIRWPFAGAAAGPAGNQSLNVIPLLEQEDKIGVGCTNDNGFRCLAGYQSIYDEEKSVFENAHFRHGLQYWNAYDVELAGTTVSFDIEYKYNTLIESEDVEQWLASSSQATFRRRVASDGRSDIRTTATARVGDDSTNVSVINRGVRSNEAVYFEVPSDPTLSGTDWTFSVWLAVSGETNVHLAFDEAPTTLLGDQLGAAHESYWSIHLSGNGELQRYWMHGNFASYVSGLSPRIYLGRGETLGPADVFVFGAQLEPTTSPSDYRRTEGSMTSGLAVPEVAKTTTLIPGHVYQFQMAASIGTEGFGLYANGELVQELSDGETNFTYTATTEETTLSVIASGTVGQTSSLTRFAMNPGTPCHAMNCPGLSAYNRIRSYRAVLPAVSVSGHQYFGTRLRLPDEFGASFSTSLPSNVLGVFDHELNRLVPDSLVSWDLANWPIGGLSRGGQVEDPEFLEDASWTTDAGDTFPLEFSPTNGSGGTLSRDEKVYKVTDVRGFTGNVTQALLHFASGTNTYPSPGCGITDGDGINNIYGPITNHRRIRTKFKPYSWFKGNSKDGNGFGVFVSHVNGGGNTGGSVDGDTQWLGFDDDGYLIWDTDTLPRVTFPYASINYGEWNDLEVVISGNASTGVGPLIFAFINGEFAGSGVTNSADWGGGTHLSAADNSYFCNPRSGGGAFNGWVAGYITETSWDYSRYFGKLTEGGTIEAYPSIMAIDDYTPNLFYGMREHSADDGGTVNDMRGTNSVAKYNATWSSGVERLDAEDTTDMSFMGLRQMGKAAWKGNEFQMAPGDDIGRYTYDQRNKWRLQSRNTDGNGFAGSSSWGVFEAIINVQSGVQNQGNLIFVQRHVPNGISGVPVVNYEFGVNISGGPYFTIAGFESSDPTPLPGYPDGYAALWCGNKPDGIEMSGCAFFNSSVDVRDGLDHHVMFWLGNGGNGAGGGYIWEARCYVDGVLHGSGVFVGPNQLGEDWSDWNDGNAFCINASLGAGMHDWSQEGIPAASGAMTFKMFTSDVGGVKASGTMYQFGFSEPWDVDFGFSTSGFHNYTRRVPFPMTVESTKDSLLWTPMDEGFGDQVTTLSTYAQAWDETGTSWPLPLYDAAQYVSGVSQIYAQFNPVTGSDEVTIQELWDAGFTPWRWYNETTLSGSVGDRVYLWPDSGPNGYDLTNYNGPTQCPFIRLSEYGKRYVHMDDGNDYALRYGGTGSATRLAGEYTVIMVYEFGTGFFTAFGNDDDAPGGFGSDSNDGISVPTSPNHHYCINYLEAQGSVGTQSSILIPEEYGTEDGQLYVVVIRRDANNKHWIQHNGYDVSLPNRVDGTSLNFHAIFTFDTDSRSTAGAALAELAILEGDIGAENARKLHNHLSRKWKAQQCLEEEAVFSWTRTDNVDTIQTSGLPADRLKICADEGERYGLEKVFPLDKDEVGVWTYRVKADLAGSGVIETYTTVSGLAEADVELTGSWLKISGANNPHENAFRVSGVEYPGEVSWASESNSYWTITRRVRALENETFIKLGLELEGDDTTNCLFLESFDLLRASASSAKFGYCGQPVLGLNWEGDAQHVLDENLLTWSEQPVLWPANSGTVRGFGVDLETGYSTTNLNGVSGYFEYSWPAGSTVIKDSTLSVKFLADSINPSATDAQAYVELSGMGVGAQTQSFALTNGTQTYHFTFSGVDQLMPTDLRLRIYPPRPGGDLTISQVQAHHGSGLVDYIPAYQKPVETYRKQLALEEATTVNTGWVPGYARVAGKSIVGELDFQYVGGAFAMVSGAAGLAYNLLPTSGVVRVGNGEFAYRNKVNGQLVDVVDRWRGTPLDYSVLTSGRDIVYVPLPLPYTSISDDKVLTMAETLPAADGAWAAPTRVSLFNADISNLDRFSLTASAVPVARAVGSLLTAFVQHTADRSIHFDQNLICAAIVDPGSVCASAEEEVTLALNVSRAKELTDTVVLNVATQRFIQGTNKQFTIFWGDGTFDVYSTTNNNLRGLSHIYDLGPDTVPRTHTITVRVEDLQAQVQETASTLVTVSPRPKATQRVRAVITVPQEATQRAGAYITAQLSGTQTARAHLTIT